MPLNDIFRVTINNTLDAQTLLNVLHYRLAVDDPNGGPPDIALAQYFESIVITNYKAVMSNACTYNGTFVQKIFPIPPTVPQLVQDKAGAGTIVNTSEPTEVSVVLTKVTAFAGRAFRGRVYLPGIPISHVLASKLDIAKAPLYTPLTGSLKQTLTQGLSPFQFQPILWHVKTNSFTDIKNVLLRLEIRAQRRRQIGKGK